jgi:hypothetical protein
MIGGEQGVDSNEILHHSEGEFRMTGSKRGVLP